VTLTQSVWLRSGNSWPKTENRAPKRRRFLTAESN